jgi:hypothetical protein
MLRTRFVLACLVATWSGFAAQAANDFAAPAGGVAPQSAVTAEPLPPELQRELDALKSAAWHPSATVRTSLGWRDNILLSPFAPLERTFGRAELEAILLRPMRNRWEVISFLTGDVLRYFSPPAETGGEQQWSLHAEGRWQPVEAARLALKGAGYFRDLVVDLSETEARRVIAPTRVRGGYLTTATRFTLPAGIRFEPAVQAKRTDYRDYAGDYDELRSGGRLEWRRGRGFGAAVAWYESRRTYAQRGEYTAGGRPLPGTQLRFRQRDGEVRIQSAWTAGGEWSAAVAAGRVENRDGASGYFDFDQQRARLELRWSGAHWGVHLDADAKRLDYLVQTVGAGLVPPPRIVDDYEVALRIERPLRSGWLGYAEQRWERSRSNEVDFSYRANTFSVGIQREF